MLFHFCVYWLLEPIRPKPKRKEHPATTDPQVVDDALIYAQPNKRAKQAKSVTQAGGSRGKSPTGKGKKSRKF